MTKGLIKYHLQVLFREPMNLFFGLGLPFLNVFMVSGNLDAAERPYAINVALPIFIILATMVLCFTDSALSHVHARQTKFLRRLRMTPVKPINYILTGILSRLGVLLIFTMILIVATNIAFDVNIANKNWLLFVSILILTFVMFYVIGMFVANALKGARNSQSLLYVVFFGLLLMGNAFVPVDAMPDIVRTIAGNTPTIYAANVLQSAWLGTDILYGHSLIAVIAYTVVFGLLTTAFFKYE